MCSVTDCDREDYCRGYCSTHYNRLRTTGTVADGKYARAPVEERFWRYTEKSEGCWLWTGSTNPRGYGVIGKGARKEGKMLAHRLSWIMANGPIPEIEGSGIHGTVVMHTCDNSLCVNPDHLRIGTQKDNVQDMDRKGRRINAQLKGSKHNMSKLTEEDVVYIRSSPLSNVELAKEFNLTRQAIRYARVTGWKHV